MPSIDFTVTSDAPGSRSAATTAPDATGPVSVSIAGVTPTAGAPAAKNSPVAVPDATAPAAVAVGAITPTGAAPAAVAVSGVTPDATAPDAIDAPPAVPSAEEPDAIPAAATVPAPTGNPPGAIATAAVVPAPTGDAPGSLSAPANNGTIEPPQPASAPMEAPTDNTVNTPVINLPGMFALDAIFGQARMPANSSLVRAQIQLNDAPTGAACKVTLVDSDGVSLGVVLTVAIGEKFAETVLAEPLALLVGANVRAKVTQIGSDAAAPGGNGVVTLFTQLA